MQIAAMNPIVVRKEDVDDAQVAKRDSEIMGRGFLKSIMDELPTFAAWFDGSRVDEGLVADVLACVSRWRARGIAVYAYRPPTTPEMVALERQRSGFVPISAA